MKLTTWKIKCYSTSRVSGYLYGGCIQIEIIFWWVSIFRLRLPRLIVLLFSNFDYQDWWYGRAWIKISKSDWVAVFRLRLSRLMRWLMHSDWDYLSCRALYLDWDCYIDIFITHFLIIIKSEVSTFPIVVIFFSVVVMMTSSNGTISAFFDLRLNKPLSKQSWGWWFETLSRPLWRHCNVCLR